MSRSVYVASPEGQTGKSAVALGLVDALTREVGSVGIFRPLTTVGTSSGETDLVVDLLVHQPGIDQTYEEALGVTYEAAREDADEALHQIVERFGQLTDRFEVIVVVGSDYADVASGTELSFNAKIAANLGSPVVLVVHGRGRTPDQIRAAADSAVAELQANHARTVAVIANRVEAADAEAIRAELGGLSGSGGRGDRGEPAAVGTYLPGSGRGGRRGAGARLGRLDGPGVARADRGRDEPAQRARPARSGHHRDRAQ